SSHGIGRTIALELARNGYNIGITYHSRKEGAQELYNEILNCGVDAMIIGVDVAELSGIERMFDELIQKFGRIDVLVNNAGVGLVAPFLTTTPDLFEKLTNTDWRAGFFCAQRAAKEMISLDIKGVIINIASNHSDGCWPDCSVYAGTKAALVKFTKNCAMELAEYGIRVVCVNPGYTDIGWAEDDPIQEAVSKMPLGRFGTTQEIANLVAFLVSDKASYITGTTITSDGGALLPCVPENNFSGGGLMTRRQNA
ncbi:MAG: SDR family oxidoreductase, partial [Oscillospiraceae bacterium]